MKFKPYMFLVVLALLALMFYMNMYSAYTPSPSMSPASTMPPASTMSPAMFPMTSSDLSVTMTPTIGPNPSIPTFLITPNMEKMDAEPVMEEQPIPTSGLNPFYSIKSSPTPNFGADMKGPSGTCVMDGYISTGKPVGSDCCSGAGIDKSNKCLPFCTSDGAKSNDFSGMGGDCCSGYGVDSANMCMASPPQSTPPPQYPMTNTPALPMCPTTCQCPTEVTGYNLNDC